MNNKTAELLLAQQQLKEVQHRVRELEMELEGSGEKYVIEWFELGRRHREVFACMDAAANFWKDISAVCVPTLHKVFV